MRRVLALLLVLLSAVSVSAQTRTVTADAVRLNTVPCQLTSGTAAPSGGANCDMYLQSDGTLWVKANGAWTGVTMASLTTNANAVNTFGGSRPTTINSATGVITTTGDSGGWAFGHYAAGYLGAALGGFGWYGGAETLYYYFIGPAYNTPYLVVRQDGGAGNVGIGTTWPNAKLHVSVFDSTVTPRGDAAMRVIGSLNSTGVLTLTQTDTNLRGVGLEVYTLSPGFGTRSLTMPSIWDYNTVGIIGAVFDVGGYAARGIVGYADGTGTTAGGYFAAKETGSSDAMGVHIGPVTSSAGVAYALYSEATARSYFAGNVGIGTPAPQQKFVVSDTRYGFEVVPASTVQIFAYDRTGGVEIPLQLGVSGATSVSKLADGSLQNPAFVPQTTAWNITAPGWADFRGVYAEEMHVKSFTADLEQALVGGQIIAKSVVVVAAAFTLPAQTASTTFIVEDIANMAGMDVFVAGDFLRFRQFTRGVNSLDVADAWGTVSATAHAHNGDGTQTWTFVRSADPDAGTGSGTIARGQLCLDYGVTTNGIIEATVLNSTGQDTAPYTRYSTWTTHPKTGMQTQVQIGNLNGQYDYATPVYGFAAGNSAATWVSVDATNGFRIQHGSTSKVSVDASGNASFAGTITAPAGNIGGFTIAANTLTSGAGAWAVGMSSAGNASYATTVLADAPTAYWRLNESSGDAADSTAGARTMTATGGPTYSVQGGRYPTDLSTAMTFVEDSSYVSRNDTLLTMTADWTVSLWAYSPTGTHQGELFAQSKASNARSYIHLYIYGNEYWCDAADNASGGVYTGATGVDYSLAWHHVACTWDVSEKTMAIYVDGVERSRSVYSTVGTWDAMDRMAVTTRFQNSTVGGGSDSTVQDVAVWASTALTATQINAHYTGTAYWAGSTTPTAGNFYVTAGGFLKATNALVGGWSVGSSAITSSNIRLTSGGPNAGNIAVGSGSYLAGLNSAVAGTDIAFWAGSTFANRATAPTTITAAGLLTATGATIKSAAGTGARAEFTSAGLITYNSSNAALVTLDGNGVAFSMPTAIDDKRAFKWDDTHESTKPGLYFNHSGIGELNEASLMGLRIPGPPAHGVSGVYLEIGTDSLTFDGSQFVPSDSTMYLGSGGYPWARVYATALYLNGNLFTPFPGGSLTTGGCSGSDKVTDWTVDANGIISGFTCGADPSLRELASLRALVADLQARLSALEGSKR
jgi:hypothetical protein